MRKIYLLFAVLLIILVPGCRGQIRCFVCSTAGGLYASQCGDKFSLVSVDSSTCAGTCLKARGERQAGSRNEIEVHRGCVERRADGCSKGDYYGMSADICYCNTELCNAAGARIMSVWTVGVVSVVSTVLALVLT